VRLPLILLNGTVISQGCYPTRDELARLAGAELEQPSQVQAGAKLPVINTKCCRKIDMTTESMTGFLEQATRILFFTGKGGVERHSLACCGGGVDGSEGPEGLTG